MGLDGRAPTAEKAAEDLVSAVRTFMRGKDPFPGSTMITMDGTLLAIQGVRDETVPSTEVVAGILEELERVQQQAKSVRSAGGSATTTAPAVHLRSTPSGSITEQWRRIERWLAEELDAAALPGASRPEIAAAESASGIEWPSELCELFELMNSFAFDKWVPLLPMDELLSLDRVVNERQIELEVWSVEDYPDALEGSGPDAGSAACTYLPDFVPFAGMDGNLLILDMRPGSMQGCVSRFDREGPDQRGPRWSSLSAMLTDLADSLCHGNGFDGGWFRSVHNRKLEWNWHPTDR